MKEVGMGRYWSTGEDQNVDRCVVECGMMGGREC